MTQHLGVRALALLLPVAALVAASPAAHADRAVTTDPAGDVVLVDRQASEDAETGVLVPAPKNSTSDITRVSVDHRPRLLRVSVKMRKVGSSFGDTMMLRLRTPERRADLMVMRQGRETFTTMSRGFRQVKCRKLSSTVDLRTDKIIVSVPTSCIDTPRWIQVGVIVVGAQVEHGTDTGNQLRQFVDDGFREGVRDDGWKLGDRVRRG